MRKRKLLDCLLILFAGLVGRPQTVYGALDPGKALTQYIHDSWQIENGLPQNSVLAMAQTPDGYIWIGTEDGLARFDGVQFTTFNKHNTPQFQINEISALLVDRKGDYGSAPMAAGLFVTAMDSLRASHPPMACPMTRFCHCMKIARIDSGSEPTGAGLTG